jgi:hypothetical protein
MPPRDERRSDYLELSEIKVQLAIAVTEMKGLTNLFTNHIDDDKKTAAEVSDIKLNIATFKGKIVIISSLCGCGVTWMGVLITIYFKSRGIL